MKAISHFKYLFQRNKVFYFRFKLSKQSFHSEIVFSLKTKVLADAVYLWQKLIPYTEKLKQLALLSGKFNERQNRLFIKEIKSEMLKKLQLNQIDELVAEMEQNCLTSAHMMKAAAGNDGISFSDNDRERIVYLLGDREEKSFNFRLGKVFKTLPFEEQDYFLEALAGIVCMIHKFDLTDRDDLDLYDEREISEAKGFLQRKGFVIE